MRKFVLACCLLATAVFTVPGATLAATSPAAPTIHLNVNGSNLTDLKPIVFQQTTLVPIRALTFIPAFGVNWDNNRKTATITNKTTKETVKLTPGSKTAIKGSTKLTLSVPARAINGLVYVPLRFVAEALGGYATWDVATRTAIITYSPSNGAVESRDIATAREAVLRLPQIALHEPIITTEESHIAEYYFPYGQTQRFIVMYRNVASYYEVRNHAAWKLWEGENSEWTPTSSPPVPANLQVIPHLVSAVSREWGTRPPAYSGAYAYFTDFWMAGQVSYGILDADGVRKEAGSYQRADGDSSLIKAIPGEVRTD